MLLKGPSLRSAIVSAFVDERRPGGAVRSPGRSLGTPNGNSPLLNFQYGDRERRRAAGPDRAERRL
jgi:hypothetical protein